MLAAGVGEVDDAHNQLKALRRDICRQYGSESPAVAEVDLLIYIDQVRDGARR